MQSLQRAAFEEEQIRNGAISSELQDERHEEALGWVGAWGCTLTLAALPRPPIPFHSADADGMRVQGAFPSAACHGFAAGPSC